MDQSSIIIKNWLNILISDTQIHQLQENLQSYLEDTFEYNPTKTFAVQGHRESNKNDGYSAFKVNIDDEEAEIVGYFHANQLVGNVLMKTKNSVELFFCKKGIRHGYARKLIFKGDN